MSDAVVCSVIVANAAGLGTVMLNHGTASYSDNGIFVNNNYNSQMRIIYVLVSLFYENVVKLPCELKLKFPEPKINHSLKFLCIYVFIWETITLLSDSARLHRLLIYTKI